MVSDLAEMQALARAADDFVQLLRARHATILAGRLVLPRVFQRERSAGIDFAQ